MADYQQFSMSRLAPATMSVPRWRVEVKICDSRTGAVLRDFTGANALVFPNILGAFTPAQQDRIVELIVGELIERRAESA